MNTVECEILKKISENLGTTQRELSELCDISVGKANQVVQKLTQNKLILKNLFFGNFNIKLATSIYHLSL